jgi:hypothetical protein
MHGMHQNAQQHCSVVVFKRFQQPCSASEEVVKNSPCNVLMGFTLNSLPPVADALPLARVVTYNWWTTQGPQKQDRTTSVRQLSVSPIPYADLTIHLVQNNYLKLQHIRY